MNRVDLIIVSVIVGGIVGVVIYFAISASKPELQKGRQGNICYQDCFRLYERLEGSPNAKEQ